MTDDAMRPRAGSSAKAVLLTMLGEFVLPHGGTAWTSTMVRSLAAMGVEERNARQAVARLADQQILDSRRDGRRVCWRLTPRGRQLLETGTARIYGFGDDGDTWDGRWLVVLCSVPEDQRFKRHHLRSRLGFAGFGFLAPGIALSPHLDREPVANTVLEELDLVPGGVVLRAEVGDLVDADELLRRAWDLDSLAASYEAFIQSFARRRPANDEEQFANLVELVHEWRRFPFGDPELPARLLPPKWPGRAAKELFVARHAAWAPAANAWYEELEASS